MRSARIPLVLPGDFFCKWALRKEMGQAIWPVPLVHNNCLNVDGAPA